MRQTKTRPARGWLRSLRAGALLAALAVLGIACQTDLSGDFEGLQCSSSGECLSGYVCNEENGRCERPGTMSTAGMGGGGAANVTCR